MRTVMDGKALILTDGKAGHENQSKAFARLLGLEYELLPVRFKSPAAKALSYLLDRLGVRTARLLDGLGNLSAAAGCRVVIGTGSGTFYAAKVAAKALGVPCGVVLYPRGYALGGFGCILAPSFDRPAAAGNVVPVPANLVAADGAFYAAGVKAFRERYEPSGKKAVAVIVGGPNKCASLSPEWMKGELDRIFAETESCERWVTTSRRTPPEVDTVVESFKWDYALIYSKDTFNPIPAFVKLASRLYVTAESTGMLSEACTCGEAEVFALDNLGPGGGKFRRFVESLKAGGYVGGRRKIDLSPEIARAKALLGI